VDDFSLNRAGLRTRFFCACDMVNVTLLAECDISQHLSVAKAKIP
jgi:hypothetical protein